MNKSNTKSKDKVSNLEKELKELKEKLETLEKDTKKGDDIYNDGRKGGWFGSNLLKR
jgi:septal ring factor EnvC (AmiA/AmiB activator)